MRKPDSTWLVALALLGGACTHDLDAIPRRDGGTERDAGDVDGGMTDGSRVDGGPVDATVPDAPGIDAPGVDGGPGAPTPRSCGGVSLGCGVDLVPRGTFQLGDRDAWEMEGAQGEFPNVSVSSFYIDAYEVTVARFRRFWSDATARTTPAGNIVYPNTTLTISDSPREPGATTWTATPAANETRPILSVTPPTAHAFCVWDGGRLPTEAEWEYAARGRTVGGLPPGRVYAWGNTPAPDCMHAIMSTCTVGSGGPPEHVGVTDEVEGLWDLSGNAWELTADVYLFGARSGCAIRDAADPLCIDGSGLRTVTAKGGGYLDSAEDQFRAASRRRVGTAAAFTDVGFRCVYPVP